MKTNPIFQYLFLSLTCVFFAACSQSNTPENQSEQVTIVYWEKWSLTEKDAMLAVIDRYHESQDKIRVQYITTADNRMKTLLATAGGNPPDLAGLFPEVLPKYAEKEALYPLDVLMERDGLSQDDYVESIIQLCEFKEHIWALPSTPASLALHYNKRHFREAGLDPDRAPRTLQELDWCAKALTKYHEDGRIIRMGFSPESPTWFRMQYLYWFDGSLWDGHDTITFDSPEGEKMLEWVRSYPDEYGLDNIQRFQSSEGQFNSAQNHFISGRVSMQLQGVWMANFIDRYNPNLEWGAAPFPTEKMGDAPTTFVDTDVLVIPKGAKHPEEAWDFIKFVQQQENMELLCGMQGKFSPLKEVSQNFYDDHSNPYIDLFRELAESPNAHPAPQVAIVDEIKQEVGHAVSSVWLGEKTPEEALEDTDQLLQQLLNQHHNQWDRVQEARQKSWKEMAEMP